MNCLPKLVSNKEISDQVNYIWDCRNKKNQMRLQKRIEPMVASASQSALCEIKLIFSKNLNFFQDSKNWNWSTLHLLGFSCISKVSNVSYLKTEEKIWIKMQSVMILQNTSNFPLHIRNLLMIWRSKISCNIWREKQQNMKLNLMMNHLQNNTYP